MSRLTDERLTRIVALYSGRGVGSMDETVAMATELKERRAGELTEEEREALAFAKQNTLAAYRVGQSIGFALGDGAKYLAAMSAIDKLLLANGGAR